MEIATFSLSQKNLELLKSTSDPPPSGAPTVKHIYCWTFKDCKNHKAVDLSVDGNLEIIEDSINM
jgi:hypothetical protein